MTTLTQDNPAESRLRHHVRTEEKSQPGVAPNSGVHLRDRTVTSGRAPAMGRTRQNIFSSASSVRGEERQEVRLIDSATVVKSARGSAAAYRDRNAK